MSAKSLLALNLLARGQYFADWLVLRLLRLDAPLAWNTWRQYFQALILPQYLSYAVKVKTVGAISFGVPNDAQNPITNHGCHIVFTPREQSDANACGEMPGNRTMRKKNRSRTSGGQDGSRVSISYSEEKRPLMHPQEIKELPPNELIFKKGCRPIKARKNWFFKGKQFVELTKLPPVAVEPLAQRLAAQDAKPAKKRFAMDEIMRQSLLRKQGEPA